MAALGDCLSLTLPADLALRDGGGGGGDGGGAGWLLSFAEAAARPPDAPLPSAASSAESVDRRLSLEGLAGGGSEAAASVAAAEGVNVSFLLRDGAECAELGAFVSDRVVEIRKAMLGGFRQDQDAPASVTGTVTPALASGSGGVSGGGGGAAGGGGRRRRMSTEREVERPLFGYSMPGEAPTEAERAAIRLIFHQVCGDGNGGGGERSAKSANGGGCCV